jgi:exodeoxyribonuclease-5
VTILTTEQSKAVEEIRRWYSDLRVDQPVHYGPGPFRLFGAAGVGKTTLAKHITEALGVDAVFGAYTGKAASVLRRKGVPATTIHSAIYRPVGDYGTRKRLREMREELTQMESEHVDVIAAGWASGIELAGAISETQEQIAALEAELRRPEFELNEDSPWADADLIVLDEVSMVDAKMAADIEGFGVPVLVLGDPHQLPPIGGQGYYTDAKPDVELIEVHRQALESPVLALATEIRRNGLGMVPRVRVSLDAAMEADQVLVWKNSTRWALVQAIRQKLGRPAGVPVAGDRVMCLTNNREMGILNGQQYEVLGAHPVGQATITLELRDEDGRERTLDAYAEGFQGLVGEAPLKNFRAFRGQIGAFTFANCITVHKAQGSEWPHVYVVDQTAGLRAVTAKREGARAAEEMARRWLYTAVSRASERVTIASITA